MLTAKNVTATAAVDYFTQYYDAEQTRWQGKGAAKLGLSGQIDSKEIFEQICQGNAPDGRQLGSKATDQATRRAALDCTFSAPKSVSLTALVGGDTRLEVAHRLAVAKTLALMEQRYAQTRIRTGDTRPTIATGNLVVAQFDHIESRELDPHLHTHALVMNLTQTESGQWYSLSNEEIFRNKKHLGTIYQSYLAAEVEKLGYQIEPRPHGQFELKGYQPADLVEFSKRRQQILAEVPAGSTWQTREDAWSLTRKHKQHLSPDELKSRWQAEAAALKIQIVQPSQHYRPSAPRRTPSQYLDDAISHCSERSVEFAREDLEKFALAHRMPTDIAEIATLTARHPQLIPVGKKFTTFAALRREDETISLMKQGEGQLTPIATPATVTATLDRSTLNIGQRQAVRLAATTTDRVVAWQGVAGAGKTFALTQLKEIAERQGYELSGYAPSAEAAKVLGGELGIPADTVAKKLVTPPAAPTHNRIWVVDEAGLLGASEAMQLLRLAEIENARVLLVGDTRQLSAVSAGNPFKSLQQAGMATARLSQSLRQRNPDLKTAVDLLADGMVEQGFHQLVKNGNIIDVSAATMVAQIARE